MSQGINVNAGPANDRIDGTAQDDAVDGGSGADTLYGQGGNDTLAGGLGEDWLDGGDGNDALTGGRHADRLYGQAGDDTLDGGAGDDSLFGGVGNDTYLFGRGSGNDFLRDAGDFADVDVLRLVGLNPADVLFQRSSASLTVTIRDTGETLNVFEFFSTVYNLGGPTDIERIEFADGTVWTGDYVQGLFAAPTAGDDYLDGTEADDTLEGLAGNDYLNGIGGNDSLLGGAGNDFIDAGAGDDTLEGGGGNDVLLGGSGANVYRFGGGEGSDYLDNSIWQATGADATDDVLQLWGEYPSTVAFTRELESLVITVLRSGETLRVQNWFYADEGTGYSASVGTIRFHDGTTWSVADVNHAVLTMTGTSRGEYIGGSAGNESISGGAGDDSIYGAGGDDRLDGQAGDDYLGGGGGADTYVFGRGSGHDVVDNYAYADTAPDTIELVGINPADVLVRHENVWNPDDGSGGDLVVTVRNTGETLRVLGYFNPDADAGSAVGRIQFANGTVWTAAEIRSAYLAGSSLDDLMHGTPQADAMQGSNGHDTLYGYAGNDTLAGVVGHDVLYGGDGNDLLSGSADNDTLYGGEGNDDLRSNGGTDWVFGEGGDDILRSNVGSQGGDMLSGGFGSDTYVFDAYARGVIDNSAPGDTAAPDTIQVSVSSGAGLVLYQAGMDLVILQKTTSAQMRVMQFFAEDAAEAGYDRLTINFVGGLVWDRDTMVANVVSAPVPIVTEGFDFGYELIGGLADDVLSGGGGNDTLDGGAGGDDLLQGGNGDDTYYWGLGSGWDVIANYGDPEDVDTVVIDAAYEQLSFVRSGYDLLIQHQFGGFIQAPSFQPLRLQDFFDDDGVSATAVDKFNLGGTEWTRADLLGITGNFTLGGAGDDLMIGTNAGDTFNGRGGDDTILGGGGDDRLIGNADHNMLLGGQGNDTLSGSRDGMYGEEGDDQLLVTGLDVAYGGTGADTYIFSRSSDRDTVVVAEYQDDGAIDRLQLNGLNRGDLEFTQDGLADLLIRVKGTDDSVRVSGYFEQAWLTGAPNPALEQIAFADGTVWGYAQVQAAVNAGTSGADRIDGWGDSNDTMKGAAGNDVLWGGGGDDALSGSAGDDSLFGDVGNDWLAGGDGNDYVEGGAGDDALDGNAGSDVLLGGTGSDTYIFGMGSGNDYITNFGSDQFEWEAVDTLLVSGLYSNSVVASHYGQDLVLTVAGTLDSVTVASYFDHATDDSFLIRFSPSNEIWGYSQVRDAVLHATQGDDHLEGFGDTNQSISGLGGEDWILGASGDDTLDGGLGNDWVQGDYGDDLLSGGAGDDNLAGGPGTDTYVFGRGSGHDTLWTGADDAPTDILQLQALNKSDVYFDRQGGDLVITLIASSESVLVQQYFDTDGSTGSTLDRIVFQDGTSLHYADVLAIIAADQGGPVGIDLQGDGSNEFLVGGAGNDTLRGGGGNDTLTGGSGGNDMLNGDDGDDVIVAGPGADSIDGGAGYDTLVYDFAGRTAPLVFTATGAGGTQQDPTDGSIDVLSNVEQLQVFGGTGNDSIVGDAMQNFFDGREGNDTLTGGGNGDVFSFNSSGPGAHDVITDFSLEDTLQLASGFTSIVAGEDPASLASGQVMVRVGGSATTLWVRSADGGIQQIDLQGSFSLAQFYLEARPWGTDVRIQALPTQGDDNLQGTSGNDTIDGLGGRDYIDGGAGNDSIMGGAGPDYLVGGGTYSSGADTIDGGADYDAVSYNYNGTGTQVVFTSTGATGFQVDPLDGLTDTLRNIEELQVFGGNAGDILTGDAQRNFIEGAGGDDTLAGGGGFDTFSFVQAQANGRDRITDMDAGDNIVVRDLTVTSFVAGNDPASLLLGQAMLATPAGGVTTLYVQTQAGLLTIDIVGSFTVDRFGLASDAFGTNFILRAASTEGPDNLNGAPGNDSIDGLGGNDFIDGGKGNDTLIGGAGDDFIVGGGSFSGGSDSIDGGTGNDVVAYDYGAETTGVVFTATAATGSQQDAKDGSIDTLLNIEQLHVYGGSGDDRLTGDAMRNFIEGRGGNDTLGGGGGDDVFSYDVVRQNGIDRITDLGLNDVLHLNGMTVSGPILTGNDPSYLQVGQAMLGTPGGGVTRLYVGGGNAGGSLLTIELVGSFKADQFSINTGAFGTDLRVRNGATTGNDTIVGGSGNELIDGLAGNDSLDGGAGSDTLVGGPGNDTLVGGPGGDDLFGGVGSDVLIGGQGDDYLDGGEITDRINYTDLNTVTYGNSTSGIFLDLEAGEAEDGLGGVDELVNINFVVGSNNNDTLMGSSAQIFEQFDGGLGNDYIDGGAIDRLTGANANRVNYANANAAVVVDLGQHSASGGMGNDQLFNISALNGSRFADSLTGSDATDYVESFNGRGGNDFIDGRGGFDIARYDNASAAVTVNLALRTASDGEGGTDTLRNIEGVRGSASNDTLIGGWAESDSLETFLGLGGNDSIDGGSGFDRVDYVTATVGVNVTLGGSGVGTASDGQGGVDQLRNIEGVRGSSLNDILTGSGNGGEVLEGAAGNDSLTGGGGDDTFAYDALAAAGRDRIADFGEGDVISLAHLAVSGIRQDGDPATLSIGEAMVATGQTSSTLYVRVGGGADGILAIDLDGSFTAGNFSLATNASGSTFTGVTAGSGNHPPTGSVWIDGLPAEGEFLTASNDLADADGGTDAISYQWLRDGVAIVDATDFAYQLTQQDIGTAVSVVASYTDGNGTIEQVSSAPTELVLNTDEQPTGEVTIVGTLLEGEVLTVESNLVDPDGNIVDVSYVWARDGEVNAAETGATYTLTQDDVGATISVVVLPVDELGGMGFVYAETTGTVANINNGPTGSVTIAGSPLQGEELFASNSLADEDGLGAITYRWMRDGVAITDATGSSYVLTQDDVGASISVAASYTDLFGAQEEVVSASTGAVENVNDGPTGAVLIGGVALQGEVLTASNTLSDIDGGTGAISYQWLRDGSAIAGATGFAYALTQSDVGAAISVAATYTDGFGTAEEVRSAATVAVVNVNDAPTGGLAIAGTARQGEVLTVDSTLADADGMGVVSYQWLRNGTAVTGATGASYTLGQSDVGASITVTASYTDDFGQFEQVVSAATSAVENVNDGPTGAVTLAGLARQGEVLSVSNDLGDLDGMGAVSYQWLRNGVAVTSATAASYTLGQSDVGAAITVAASYTDGYGHAERVTSAATALVENVNDAPIGEVGFTGEARQGALLTLNYTLSDADGMGAVSQQWFRDGFAIAGATGTSYRLSQADVGKAITVAASYTDEFGAHESVASAPSAPVQNVNDAPTGGVTLAGAAVQYGLLTASNTLQDLDGLGPVSYQWLRDGMAIGGATSGSYQLTQADVGKSLAAAASYTDGYGAAEQVVSAATSPVANVNDAPAGTLGISGIAQQGATLSAVNALSDLDGLGALSYQWLRGGVAVAGATGVSYVLGQVDVGKTIQLSATYTDGFGAREHVASALTAPVQNVNDAPEVRGTIPSQAAKEDAAFSYVLNATSIFGDIDGDALSLSVQNLPSWLTFNAATRTLSGTPRDGAAGPLTLVVKATDPFGASAQTTLQIAVADNPGEDWTGTRKGDVHRGTAGQDTLTGDDGADYLDGGAGSDWLIGGQGNDTFATGTGWDTLVLGVGSGKDTVTDFKVGIDRILLVDGAQIASISQIDTNKDGLKDATLVNFVDHNDVLTLMGTVAMTADQLLNPLP